MPQSCTVTIGLFESNARGIFRYNPYNIPKPRFSIVYMKWYDVREICKININFILPPQKLLFGRK